MRGCPGGGQLFGQKVKRAPLPAAHQGDRVTLGAKRRATACPRPVPALNTAMELDIRMLQVEVRPLLRTTQGHIYLVVSGDLDPATHTPSFDAEPGARLIPVNDLVRLTGAASGYTVIGGGKTAMDACMWLLESGVPPEVIRWIRPRDAWLLDRAFQQPLDLVTWLIEGVSLYLEAAAQAEDVSDLFGRLEACGQLVRLDPAVEPAMYRCATVSQAELGRLRRIENVVRLGRVVHIAADRIVLEEGSIPTDGGQVHVDCSAAGLRLAPGRPAFDAGRITLQQIRTCQPAFNAALVGYVEATRHDDAEKNRLCPPNPYPDTAIDWIPATCIAQRAQALWLADTDLSAWIEGARLNAARGIGDHLADPRMKSALTRMFANAEPAVAKLETLQAQAQQAGR